MRPPPQITLTHDSGLRDVGAIGLLEQVLGGTRPHFWTGWLEIECAQLPEPGDLLQHLPEDAVVLRSGMRVHNMEVFAEGPDYHVLVVVGTGGGHAEVAADTYETARDIGTAICNKIEQAHHADDDKLAVTTWRRSTSQKYSTYQTRIERLKWGDIASNYPEPTRSEIGYLASLVLDETVDPPGRLVLWHGQPGTGKTYALRALLAAWSAWCRPELLIDPEVAFSDPDYLFALITRAGNDHRPWRLLVVEDADKFLTTDARVRDNPALDRLLNLTDGILGQGQRLLVLLTTNSQLGSLHPAIVRPGRCLAVTEFRRFSAARARTWLGRSVTDGDSPTLAELFQARGELERIGELAQQATGQYL